MHEVEVRHFNILHDDANGNKWMVSSHQECRKRSSHEYPICFLERVTRISLIKIVTGPHKGPMYFFVSATRDIFMKDFSPPFS